jgi:hypothetical protein
MNTGDRVKVIYSPYSCVKKGTLATIINIRFREYGKRYTIYILDTKRCFSFYEHELEKIDENI